MRTGWRDLDRRIGGEVTLRSALRWTAAGIAVAGLHAGGVWLTLNWPRAAEAPGNPSPAIMMELAPLAVSPEVPQQDIAPGPQAEEAEDQPEPEKPIEEKLEPEPDVKPVETEIKPPEQPKVEQAEVMLPPKVEPKPQPKPKKKKQKKAPRTSAPPSSQTRRADRAAAPAEGLSSSTSRASWHSALMAHLNRYKRFPRGATGAGVATVAFTIDRSGRVLSTRLMRSSGDAALDAEAASLPRRASPVPAPPPNVGGRSIALAVPIRFSR